MIGHLVIEMYLPEWVQRQFGETQDVPTGLALFARSRAELREWGAPIRSQVAYAQLGELQPRLWGA